TGAGLGPGEGRTVEAPVRHARGRFPHAGATLPAVGGPAPGRRGAAATHPGPLPGDAGPDRGPEAAHARRDGLGRPGAEGPAGGDGGPVAPGRGQAGVCVEVNRRRERTMFTAPLTLALSLSAGAPAPYVPEAPPGAAVLRLTHPGPDRASNEELLRLHARLIQEHAAGTPALRTTEVWNL